MNLTNVLVYIPPIIAIILLIWKWPGMKDYLATGLFASWSAYFLCHISMDIFQWWSYPVKLEEPIVDGILVPVVAMLWVRYAPKKLVSLICWNLLWTLPLTMVEFYGERHSDAIKYDNGYDWYFSLGLWFISWFVWYAFHQWFNREA